MALFTKLFDRNYGPYEIAGARWYKLIVRNGAYIPSLSDDFIGVDFTAQSQIHLTSTTKGLIEYNVRYYDPAPATNTAYTRSIDIRASGQVFIPVPNRTNVLNYDVYVLMADK